MSVEVTVHCNLNMWLVALASLLLAFHIVQNDALKTDDTTHASPSNPSFDNTGKNQTEKLSVSSFKRYNESKNGSQNHLPAPDAVKEQSLRQQQGMHILNVEEIKEPPVSVLLDDLQEDGTKRHAIKSVQPSDTEADESAPDYEDDSDMFLEPDDSHHASSHASAGTLHEQEEEEDGGDVASMEQHFFPSFAPVFPSNPLGHSRPSIFQEPAHSQRPALLRPQHNSFQPAVNFGGGSFRENPYIHTAESNANGILGSGNFRVIRGGTFYSDEDQKDLDYDGRGNYYSPYYYNNNNNGHGRPAFYSGGGANPRPQNVRGSDFFANFRDFADINTPTKSSFSEYIVVYVNKNSSKHDNATEGKALNALKSKPKNIIESLTLLDEQDYALKNNPSQAFSSSDDGSSLKAKSEKKLSTPSPAKLKLALYEDKFSKQKSKKSKGSLPIIPSKDLYEPLLALS